jgi:hypothetical protein
VISIATCAASVCSTKSIKMHHQWRWTIRWSTASLKKQQLIAAGGVRDDSRTALTANRNRVQHGYFFRRSAAATDPLSVSQCRKFQHACASQRKPSQHSSAIITHTAIDRFRTMLTRRDPPSHTMKHAGSSPPRRKPPSPTVLSIGARGAHHTVK